MQITRAGSRLLLASSLGLALSSCGTSTTSDDGGNGSQPSTSSSFDKVVAQYLAADPRPNAVFAPARGGFFATSDQAGWDKILGDLARTVSVTDLKRQAPPAGTCLDTTTWTPAFTYRVDKVTTYFSPALGISAADAAKMAILAESAWRVLLRNTGTPPELTTTLNQSGGVSNQLAVCWDVMHGQKQSSPGVKSVYVETPWDGSASSHSSDETSLFQLIVHEAMHQIAARVVGATPGSPDKTARIVPAWVDEAAAVHMANQPHISSKVAWDEYLQRLASSGKPLPHQLDGAGEPVCCDNYPAYHVMFETVFDQIYARNTPNNYLDVLRRMKTLLAQNKTTPGTCAAKGTGNDQSSEVCFREAFNAQMLGGNSPSETLTLVNFQSRYVTEIGNLLGQQKVQRITFSNGSSVGGVLLAGTPATLSDALNSVTIEDMDSINDGSMYLNYNRLPDATYTLGFQRNDDYLCLVPVTAATTGGTRSLTPTSVDAAQANCYASEDATVAAPTVQFTASPTAINAGSATMLTWTATRATTCTASDSWTGPKGTSGNESVTPSGSGAKTFALTCTGAGGSTTASTAVTVTPVAPVLPTVTLTASKSSAMIGTAITLTWSSTNTNAGSCSASASPSNSGWSGSKAASSNQQVTLGYSPGSNSFTLTCTNAAGSASATVSVNATLTPLGI